MLKLFSLTLAALACSACLSPSWASGNPVCNGIQAVMIEQGGPVANPDDGIFPIPDVQVPGPDVNSPANRLEWTYLGTTTDTLTAHCFTKLLDEKPASNVTITGATSCTFTKGTLTCN